MEYLTNLSQEDEPVSPTTSLTTKELKPELTSNIVNLHTVNEIRSECPNMIMEVMDASGNMRYSFPANALKNANIEVSTHRHGITEVVIRLSIDTDPQN